ncbi:MAG: translation elongation factor Ts [Mariprofundaceae bacterium]
MAKITAGDVKKLREMTGAGMMDCKKALTETDGDIDGGVDYLRKKGLSAAAKKAGRVAAEGIVLAIANGDTGVLIEVNAETDFVSKNDDFQAFVAKLAEVIQHESPTDVAALKALSFNAQYNVEQALSQLISTIGENMEIRRFERVQVESGSVAAYVHGAGKIGVLVGINSASADMPTLGRDVAMHVAAANPLHITRDEVSEAAVERERSVLSERAAASGKPDHIIAKIVEGQLNKFYAEVCLVEQAFVKDADRTVAKVISDADSGAAIVAMKRFNLGEGIEKEESDFAAEVAAQVNG